MLRSPDYYQRITDSFGLRSALAVALTDSGRSLDIDLTYADLDPPAEFEGRPVIHWLESLTEARCRDLLRMTLAPVEVQS